MILNKRLLVWAFLAFALLVTPSIVLAAQEFSTDYGVIIDVNEQNDAHFTQNITITNLQGGTYAKEYSLSVSSSKPENISASSRFGVLPLEVSEEGNKTNIKATFPQKVIGQGKTLPFVLQYDIKDLAAQSGNVRTVIVPRLALSENLGKYDVTLRVPNSFGKASIVYPKPETESETGTQRVYTFNKEAVVNQSIYALFGDNQWYTVNTTYSLVNPNLVSLEKDVVLVPVGPYQYTRLDSVTPKPQAIRVDTDGNWIAHYQVGRGEKLDIVAIARVKLSPQANPQFNLTQEQKRAYTEPAIYWESDDSKLLAIIKEAGSDNRNGTQVTPATEATAQKLFEFVVATLQFNGKQGNEADRIGGKQALEKPQSASDKDFADLFVTLARAAKIPARVVVGVTSEQNPLIEKQVKDPNTPRKVHWWAEYYSNEKNAWQAVDPLYTSLTGGVNYFTNWDFDHITLGYLGQISENPLFDLLEMPTEISTAEVTVSASEPFEEEKPNIVLKARAITESYFGFPANAELIIQNAGNAAILNTTVAISSKDMVTSQQANATPMIIAPQSTVTVPFTYKPQSAFRLTKGSITATLNGTVYDIPLQPVSFAGRVRSLFIYPLFAGVFIGVGIYLYMRRKEEHKNPSVKRKTTPSSKNTKKRK